MPNPDPGAASRHRSLLLRHGFLLPLVLAALALALRKSGADAAISTFFYDAQAHRFLIGAHGWLELLGHQVGKSLVLAVWLLLAAAAAASRWLPMSAEHRKVLWATVLAMALGPVLVTVLKDINTHACPWNLKAYGGAVTDSGTWFVSRTEAGRCFPGGHAAGGFSLVAIAFAGEAMRKPAIRRIGLWSGLGVGCAFSLLRVAQGAHFLSHNLWSAAIDLWTAALVFSPLILKRQGATSPVPLADSPGALDA